jgi:hypothetical protein
MVHAHCICVGLASLLPFARDTTSLRTRHPSSLRSSDQFLRYNFGLISGAGALASRFSVTLPLATPSPKKMTSTVRSSLSNQSALYSMLTQPRPTYLYRLENGLGSVRRALS